VGDDVTVGHVLAELEGHGHRPLGDTSRLFTAERDGSRIVQPACEHVGDGLREDLSTIEIESLPTRTVMRPMLRPTSSQRL
jgi:hypothetical protein